MKTAQITQTAPHFCCVVYADFVLRGADAV